MLTAFLFFPEVTIKKIMLHVMVKTKLYRVATYTWVHGFPHNYQRGDMPGLIDLISVPGMPVDFDGIGTDDTWSSDVVHC